MTTPNPEAPSDPNAPPPQPNPIPSPVKTPSAQAPAPAPTPTSPSATDPFGLTDADADLKALVDAHKFESPRAVLQSYKRARELLGARGNEPVVRVPSQSRAEDPDAWKAFDAATGVPESPDKYSYKPPQGVEVNAAALKHAFAGMHKLGLNQGQVEGVLNTLIENQKQFGGENGGAVEAQAAEAALAREIEDGTAALRQAWGGAFDAQAAAAPAGIKKLDGGEDLLRLLSDAGLEKHPAVLKAGAVLAKLFGEAGSPVSGKGQGVVTVDAAKANISAFEQSASKMKAFMDGDPQTVKEFSDLHTALAKAHMAGR